MSNWNNENKAEITRQSDVISKNLRDNFTNIQNSINDNQTQIDNLTTPPAGSEVTNARDNFTVLRDRVRANGAIGTSIILTGGVVSINAGDPHLVDVTAGNGIIQASIDKGVGVEWSGQTSGIIAYTSSNSRYDVVVVNSDNSISVVTGSESADPILPTIPITQKPLWVLTIGTSSVALGWDARNQGCWYYHDGSIRWKWKIQDAVTDLTNGGLIDIGQGKYYEEVDISSLNNITLNYLFDAIHYRYDDTHMCIKSINSSGNETSGNKIINGDFRGNSKAGSLSLIEVDYTDDFEMISNVFDGNSSSSATYKDLVIENSGNVYLTRNRFTAITTFNLSNCSNDINKNNLSSAEGTGSEASAIYSHAEGTSTASGGYAHSEGFSTSATDVFSHAEGQLSVASADASHAEGRETTASGNYSHAEGYDNSSIGSSSHAEGNGTSAENTAAHAEGYQTTASGSYSHAEGSSSTASGTVSHAEGTSTASGDYSHAEGNLTESSGDYSHAEGNETTASASFSHAEGTDSTASQNGAHAEGNLTVASDFGAHAEGYATVASGFYSHSEGLQSTATQSGQHAHANIAFATAGDSQYTRYILKKQSIGGTAVEMNLPDPFELEDEKTYSFTVTVCAREDTGADNGMFKRMLLAEVTGGTASQVGSTQTIGTDIRTADIIAPVLDIVNGTPNKLRIQVNSTAAHNIRWVAVIESVEVGYSN